MLETATAQPRIWEGFLTEHSQPLAPEELDYFTRKRVLITGAGGYLGSAIARTLAALPIADLVLLDNAEYGLYRLDQHFKDAGQTPPASFLVGSVLDSALLEETFTRHAPEIVFHAAALKHVPLMEANPFAAAETNVLGTEALVDVSAQLSVSRFILLSTDKAVDPISIMGAAKRVAEQIVLRAQEHFPSQFTAIRLCNVLGSSGSVAPLFAEQIAAGRPLTLTHAEATRFFLSPTAAVCLLLRAAILPTQAGLLIPRLQAPYSVRDLARFMLKNAAPNGHPGQIIETGLRSGDKLHEQLLSSSESAKPGDHPETLTVQSSFDSVQLAAALTHLRAAIRTRRPSDLAQAIRSVVPNYLGPSEDHKITTSA